MDFLLGIGAFIAGMGAMFAFNWLVERQAYSKYMREKGARGNAQKEDDANELIVMMADAKTMFDSVNNDPKEFALKCVPQLLMKYPRITTKYGGKLMKMFGEGQDGS